MAGEYTDFAQELSKLQIDKGAFQQEGKGGIHQTITRQPDWIFSNPSDFKECSTAYYWPESLPMRKLTESFSGLKVYTLTFP